MYLSLSEAKSGFSSWTWGGKKLQKGYELSFFFRTGVQQEENQKYQCRAIVKQPKLVLKEMLWLSSTLKSFPWECFMLTRGEKPQ